MTNTSVRPRASATHRLAGRRPRVGVQRGRLPRREGRRRRHPVLAALQPRHRRHVVVHEAPRHGRLSHQVAVLI